MKFAGTFASKLQSMLVWVLKDNPSCQILRGDGGKGWARKKKLPSARTGRAGLWMGQHPGDRSTCRKKAPKTRRAPQRAPRLGRRVRACDQAVTDPKSRRSSRVTFSTKPISGSAIKKLPASFSPWRYAGGRRQSPRPAGLKNSKTRAGAAG